MPIENKISVPFGILLRLLVNVDSERFPCALTCSVSFHVGFDETRYSNAHGSQPTRAEAGRRNDERLEDGEFILNAFDFVFGCSIILDSTTDTLLD